MDLNGKNIFVAGASSGIGQATAIMISKLGGKVVLNGRSGEKLNATRSMMEGGGHCVMPYDLTQFDGMKQYVRNCVEASGDRFDGLVFSVGIAGGAYTVRSGKIDMLKSVLEENFYTYAALLKEFTSKRVLKDGGSIVALSSSATIHWEKSQVMYAASKAGLEALSYVAARELVYRKVRVNTVCPEMTNTPMAKDFFENISEEQRTAYYPLGTLNPKDVADTIVFLLSDMSRKITGQKIYLSAGNDGRPIDHILG